MSMVVDLVEDARLANREEPVRKFWTEEELYRLCEIGFFGSNRVELIDGEILMMSPAGSAHDTIVNVVADVLRPLLPSQCLMRVQSGLGLVPGTEPQPDILFTLGAQRDFLSTKPSSAMLIIEVSDTSLKYDCGEKADLYAKHGIPDYWVVDIKGRRVLVHRDPTADPSKPRGASYQSVTIVDDKGSIEPLANPGAAVRVKELLP